MVYFNEPITLTKVAEYHGDLENDVSSFNFEAEMLDKDPTSIDFGIYQTNPQYLLIVSHRTDGELEDGYNLVVSIISDSFEINNSLERKFAKRLGVALKDAPACLSKGRYSFGKEIFPVFKKHGDKAMEILKKKQ
ncbi:MAG: hypothetical protein Q7R52_01470 [archaeon]|nr:hypothetical protein [archaeon]